jgi:hypothetical protein
MARALSRSTAHAFRLSVSLGPGTLRFGESGEMSAAGRFLDGPGKRALPAQLARCQCKLSRPAASTRSVNERSLRQVSYLAQTPKSPPVILYSPECVDGAADADSQLSILRLLRRPHPANRHSSPACPLANLRRTRFDPRNSRASKQKATPRADERR